MEPQGRNHSTFHLSFSSSSLFSLFSLFFFLFLFLFLSLFFFIIAVENCVQKCGVVFIYRFEGRKNAIYLKPFAAANRWI